MRCIYCQNYPAYLESNTLTLEELKTMIKENWAIDAIKFTGGEPTLQKDALLNVAKALRDAFNIGIAIDTNGTNPNVIKELAKIGLFEAAVDLKAPKNKYPRITGIQAFEKVLDTIKILKDYNVDFEVRTTVVMPILTSEDILAIADVLNKIDVKLWVLQNFRATKYTPRELKPLSRKALESLAKKIRENYSLHVKVR